MVALILLILISFCGLLFSTAAAADNDSVKLVASSNAESSSATKEQELYDRATLVILAPRGPVLADLRISVAGLPYRQWVGRFLARQLDLDRSGTLDSSEIDLLTPRLRTLFGISNTRQVIEQISASRDSDSEAVDAAEFVLWVRHRLPQNFAISALPKAADEAVRLTSLLDLNQDGAISEAELQAAAVTLRFRDLDDDQTFSLSELMPYRDPRTQNASVSPDVASLPFFEVTDFASASRAADRILSRYADESEAAESTQRSTLTEQLLNPVFHMVIDVRLSDLANRSDVSIQLLDQAEQFCDVTKTSPGMVRLVIDGLPIVLVARGGGANNRSYVRGFLGQNFLMYDADRNQYLDESEFGSISALVQQAGATADFAAIDKNNDGMIQRDELFGYVERELAVAASEIEVTVAQDGKTLFSLLDSNQDRRLSLRELMEGFSRVRQYDISGDGKLADDELGIEYNITIGLGRSEIRRTTAQNMTAMQMRPGGAVDAILPGMESLSGPEWFRRMDRNQDGDVSRREFPGTPAMFRELDLNSDQLISSDEAEAFESQ